MKAFVAIFAASLVCLALSATAASRPAPRIRDGVPFTVAGATLAKAGIVPARLVQVGLNCGAPDGPACTEPGRMFCAADIEACYWLFTRRADDRLFLVLVSLDKFRSIEPA